MQVAIVGKAPSSRGLAPFHDEAWEIWTLSNLVSADEVPRFTRHVELHNLNSFRTRGDGYWDWMCSVKDQPIYLAQLNKDIPAGVQFPRDKVVGHVGRYFTNTVSWMIALALLEMNEAEGPHKLAVYGVDMAQDGEYAHQRPSCEYFLGLATGLGIETIVPAECDLLKSPCLYGFDTDAGEMRSKWKARKLELSARVQQAQQAAEEQSLKAAFLKGALESHAYYRQWIND